MLIVNFGSWLLFYISSLIIIALPILQQNHDFFAIVGKAISLDRAIKKRKKELTAKIKIRKKKATTIKEALKKRNK